MSIVAESIALDDIDYAHRSLILRPVGPAGRRTHPVAIIAAAIPHPAVSEGVVVAASLGVATASTTDCTCAELVLRADTALFAAKKAGRNQVWPSLASGEIKALLQTPVPLRSACAS